MKLSEKWIVLANLFCILVTPSGTIKTWCAKISTSKIYKIQNEEVKEEDEPESKKQKQDSDMGEEEEKEVEMTREEELFKKKTRITESVRLKSRKFMLLI